MRKLPDPNLPWPINMAGVAMIAEAEGCRLRAYRCPAGVWTCGWGCTDGVAPGMQWDQAQADRRFCDELIARTTRLKAMITRHAEPNQLAAMVSLAYNIGDAGFSKSTVLKQHNAGNEQAASRAFGLWNKATVAGNKVEMPGLTARRAAESALYLQPEPSAPTLRMPQAVDGESKIAASPIAQGGAVTAGFGLTGVLSQLGDQAGAIKGALGSVKGVLVETLGIPSSMFLPALAVVVGGVIVWQRYKQRIQGWA